MLTNNLLSFSLIDDALITATSRSVGLTGTDVTGLVPGIGAGKMK